MLLLELFSLLPTWAYEVAALVALAAVLLQVSVPYVFVEGTVIDPDQMNTNLSTLGNAILNRGGGTMTGQLAVIAGNAGAPGVVAAVDANTGLILTTDEVDMSINGTVRFALTPTGLALFGNALIDSNGKIPDLSSTYFAAISASNFTTGQVPVARLATGTPDATKYLAGDGSWAPISVLAPVPTVVTKNANYTTTYGEFVICTANTFTVTLPTAVGAQGRVIDVKNIGTGVITVDGAGTETIDGALTYSLLVQYQSVTLLSDGSNWVIR
jgi:hypothetical protein